MAGVLQHLRSSTLNKRPNPASMVDGQIAINYASGSPGAFFKDSNGNLVKVGPVHVGTTAPNVSPASGGTAGNSLGEQWLDTNGGTYVFKIWDGAAWRSEAGEFVNVTGDTMTGALGIVTGSASTPGLFFSGDTNTGIYSPGADQVAISTNGTRRLIITSDGKVGLGSASVLQQGSGIDGGSGAGILELYDGATGNTTLENTGAFPIIFKTNGSERMRLDSSGRLGLGTSSPSQKLSIGGSGATLDGTAAISLFDGNSLASRRWSISNGAGGNTVDLLGKLVIGYGSSVNADPMTGTAAMVIDSSGRVGIGTTAPLAKLHVNNGTNENIHFTTGGSGDQRISAINDANNATVQLSLQGSPLLFRGSGGSEVGRWDTSGRFLVGTSTSAAVSDGEEPFVQVKGTDSRGGLSLSRFSNDAQGCGLYIAKSRGTSIGSATIVANGDELGRITFSGSDGTDLNTPGASIKAEVDGTPGANDLPTRLVFSTTADGASSPTERLYLYSNGYVRAPGVYALTTAVAANVRVDSDGYLYRSTSSIRYKKDVETLQDEYADAILNARPVWFRSLSEKDNPDWGYWGFIAEEVEQIDPRLCTYGEDEEGNQRVESVQYDRFVPHLLNLIKRQQQAIETLEAKVAALESA